MIKINECYDTLNKLLDNRYFQFINNNIDLIVSAIQESINNFGNGSFEIVEQFDQEVKKEDVIDVTRIFLKYIDSSEILLKCFDECLSNNIIYLWNSNERAANWLVSNGYRREEAFSSLNLRNNCDAINNVVSIGGISIMKFIDLFRIKRKDGLITEDNIVNDTELVFLKGNDYFLEVMDLMVKGEKLPKLDYDEEIVLKNNYVCSLIKNISSLFDFSNGYFRKIITYISYCLGTYISNRFVNHSLDDKMLYIASNMNRIDDFLLMKILLDDIEDINIKCKGMKNNV